MPRYEYRCTTNERIVEVRHKMSELLRTWGELCERAGISPGRTDPAAPVEKLMSAGFIGSSARAAVEAGCEQPSCASGPCGRCLS